MLIVDSPFPPYAPVEVDVYADPVFGDLDTGRVWEDDDGLNTRWSWVKDGFFHRDGDSPAVIVEEGNQYGFYKVGVKHRLNGVAVFSRFRERGDDNYFSLYGQDLDFEGFEWVNLFAIKYGLPLWVGVLAKTFQTKLGDMDELSLTTKTVFETLPAVNAEWLLQVWGVKPDWWGSSESYEPFSRFVENIQRVVDYEKSLANLQKGGGHSLC